MMTLLHKFYYTLSGIGLAAVGLVASNIYYPVAFAATVAVEPIHACVLVRETPLTPIVRANIAECLGWQYDSSSLCRGFYQPDNLSSKAWGDETRVLADEVSFYPDGRSELKGHVEVQQVARIVNAKTAYVYRDAKTNQVTRIELYGDVRYREPDRLVVAQKVTLNPQDKSGQLENTLYRFKSQQANALLPGWGRASWMERFANQNILLRNATYSTCAPEDRAWQLEAREIAFDKAKSEGIARHAVLKIEDLPILYTPYISFSTSKERKSGFLMPQVGYSSIGGFDWAQPYYWNIAPNYDATIVPHAYALRGLMIGGNARFLTEHSTGVVGGNFLPNDRAFEKFLNFNRNEYPVLRGASNNRWSALLREHTQFDNNLQMNINFQQVSDPYYLQDFSTNLAVLTENQLLREGSLTYTTDHWMFRGMVQSYQTLHPVNEPPIADIYERLPQVLASATYDDLPMNANVHFLSQFDYYHMPTDKLLLPQGPRYHLDPELSFPLIQPWGYVTPSVEGVLNYYDVHYRSNLPSTTFGRAIPRYGVDSGLFFERSAGLSGQEYTQTLEPRLYYLYVPYQNQTAIPVYDAGYMIFNNDQLFRTNRYSGVDRVGDTNQLSYAMTTRWLSEQTGQEKASIAVGQIHYFANRRVPLCYNQSGDCVDNPLTLGYLSPDAKSSPISSRAMYQWNASWGLSGDYVWNVATRATNNGNINIHYQPATNHILSFGYSYLVSGDLLPEAGGSRNIQNGIQNIALHQATAAYAWPLTERWSTLGAYSYNISERYGMMSFLGVQYDSCCFAMRFMGGRTFKNLTTDTLMPQYNNNVYLQILLKGLGSVATSDPAGTIRTYLPGYRGLF